MKPRVLVVEDEAAILELLCFSLTQAGYAVTGVASAEAALAAINQQLPDVALLDVMLPGLDGMELARRLRRQQRSADLPILFVSARATEEDRVRGLEVGADDYIVKPFSPRELAARIQAVLRRRNPPLAAQYLEVGGIRIDVATQRVTCAGQAVELGATEYRLLFFLLSQPERVHSRSQLLNNVWGDHVFIEERTVDVHIRRLRAALAPHGATHLIQTVRGSGYRLSR